MVERILIVGLGSIGKRHLRLARKLLPNADIRILRHKIATEVPNFANGCFFSIEEALAFMPNLAVIASPAVFHMSTAKILAEAGVHLLIEKPLSTSLDGISLLVDSCQNRGTVISTGYNLRFSPSLQRYRDLINCGIVGRILSVRCEAGQYLPSWRPDADYRTCVSARRDLGGGVLLELSHEIDYLRWIFGEIDWVKATLLRQSALEIDVEDTAHITLGFHASSGERQLIATLNLDFIRHDRTRSCMAIGEGGSLRWNGLNGEVDLYEANSTEWISLYRCSEDRDLTYKLELESFLTAVEKNISPMVTGYDGLKVLEIIDLAQQSNASGGSIFKLASQTKAYL